MTEAPPRVSTMFRPVKAGTLALLSAPFFAAGAARVFVAFCCDRVFVGESPAQSCKKCKGIPTNIEVASVEQAASLGTV